MSVLADRASGAGVLDRLQVLRSAPTPLRGAPAATWPPSPRTGVRQLRVAGPGLQPWLQDTTTTRTDPAGSTLATPVLGPRNGVHLPVPVPVPARKTPRPSARSHWHAGVRGPHAPAPSAEPVLLCSAPDDGRYHARPAGPSGGASPTCTRSSPPLTGSPPTASRADVRGRTPTGPPALEPPVSTSSVFPWTPSSQEMEPLGNPGRFTSDSTGENLLALLAQLGGKFRPRHPSRTARGRKLGGCSGQVARRVES